MHPLAIKAGDSAYFSAAQLGGAFSDKIEHRLRIARLHEGFRWLRPERADNHPNWRDARYFRKRATRLNPPNASAAEADMWISRVRLSDRFHREAHGKDRSRYFLTNEHLLSLSGWAASSAGIRRRTL